MAAVLTRYQPEMHGVFKACPYGSSHQGSLDSSDTSRKELLVSDQLITRIVQTYPEMCIWGDNLHKEYMIIGNKYRQPPKRRVV